MRKSLAQAVLLVGAMHGSLASALGVGEIALASSLNQPLKAFIPLREADGLQAAQLRVELADSEAFRNAGVDRAQFLSKLEFLVEVGKDGRGRIIVSTRQPVVEPYLDFILEVRWPNGRMLREYTVLLDLPVFESDAAPARPAQISASSTIFSEMSEQAEPAAVEREPGGSRGSVPVSAPVLRESTSAAGLRPRPADQKTDLPASGNDQEYRVQHHDTMWKIAARLRPSPFVTTEQTMIALLRKNPDAFIGNNINRVKSGYLLKAPSEDEAKALDHSDALREIRQQASDWRRRRSSSAAPAGASAAAQQSAPQLDATKGAEQAPSGAAGDDVRFSIGSAGDSASGEEVDALRQRLRNEQEVLEKVQLENASMATRVREMEKQVDTLQKLIALKNRELAALQAGLASQPNIDSAQAEALAVEIAEVESDLQDDQQVLAEREAEIAASAPEVAGGDAGLGDEGGEQPAVAGEQLSDEGGDSAAPEGEAPASVIVPAPAKPWYLTPLYQYIAAGVSVFLLLLLALRRRSQAAEEDDAQAFDAVMAPPVAAAEKASDADADAVQEAAAEVDIPNLDEPADDSAAEGFDFDSLGDMELSTGETAGDEALTLDQEPVEPQTDDAISEAEIYVAYGRYDQAASLLKSAIAKEPGNAELQLKLLDIYLDTRDREAFLEGYRQLEASGDSAALARVKESMSAVEGVSGWLDDGGVDVAPDFEAVADGALDDLDSELSFLDDDAASSVAESAAEAEVAGDSSESELEEFELQLDDDFDLDALADEGGAESDVLSAEEPTGQAGAFSTELEAFAEDGDGAAEGEPDSLSVAADDTALGEGELGSGEDQGMDLELDADLGEFDFDLGDDETTFSADSVESEGERDDRAADLSDVDSALAELDADTAELSLDDVEAGDASLAGLDADTAELSLDDAEIGDASLEDSAGDELADLDAALADLDAEVGDLSSTAEEALEEPSADAGDKPADDEQALDLDDLVFDEFSADELSEDALSDDEIGTLSDSDDITNKLDLARMFVEMGDVDSARDALNEVLELGNEAQQAEASALLEQLK